jgi:hypothetical protein
MTITLDQNSGTMIGNDVVGIPGQNMTEAELRALVGMADGETPSATSEALSIKPSFLPLVESNIRRKLGAITKPHMITRGFVLGILRPRALTTFGVGALLLTGFLYYQHQHHHLPDVNSPAMQYDIMAGGSHGPVVNDPRYLELLQQKRH